MARVSSTACHSWRWIIMTAGFVRTGGLFAFARRTPSDDFLVLHFEMAAAINRVADHSHPRWGWCLGEGLDTLLVHLAGRPARLPANASPDLETVLWHPEAEVVMDVPLPGCDLARSLVGRPAAPIDAATAARAHSA